MLGMRSSRQRRCHNCNRVATKSRRAGDLLPTLDIALEAVFPLCLTVDVARLLPYPSHMMNPHRKTLLAGSLTAICGLALVIVFMLQPWRACAYGDVPADCSANPSDTVWLTFGFIVFIAGVSLLTTGIVQRRRAMRSQFTSPVAD